MLNFNGNMRKIRSLVLLLLTASVLSLSLIGLTAGQENIPQNDIDMGHQDTETQDSEGLEIVDNTVSGPLEMLEYYMSESDILSRSADYHHDFIDTDDDDEFAVLSVSSQATDAAAEKERITAKIQFELHIQAQIESFSEADVSDIVFQAVDYPVYVAVSRLNMRASPSTDAEVLTQLKMADKVECQGENEAWLEVCHDGLTGYVAAEYLSRQMVFRPVDQTLYVDSNALNLREKPTTSATAVTQLKKHDKLTRTGIGDGWSAVTTSGGVKGYVSTQHLTDQAPPAPTPAPAPAHSSRTSRTSSNEDEKALFTRIVAMESASQYGYEGYLAVATVIMNRVASSRFPNSITGVVSQPGQFSVYTSSRRPHYNDNVHKAVRDALDGKRNLPSYVLFFAMPHAYERNAARGGVFGKLEVYERSHGHVWCYYTADRR